MNSVKATNGLTQEQILEVLPHGSGINCEWQQSETKVYWCFQESFHTMDEYGGYDGYAYFTLKIPKSGDMIADFVLQFNGSQSQYLNRKYLLREYLEDTFANVLRTLQSSATASHSEQMQTAVNLLLHWIVDEADYPKQLHWEGIEAAIALLADNLLEIENYTDYYPADLLYEAREIMTIARDRYA